MYVHTSWNSFSVVLTEGVRGDFAEECARGGGDAGVADDGVAVTSDALSARSGDWAVNGVIVVETAVAGFEIFIDFRPVLISSATSRRMGVVEGVARGFVLLGVVVVVSLVDDENFK